MKDLSESREIPDERWLPIRGHQFLEISDHGRIRSYRSKNGKGKYLERPRILTLQRNRVSGYVYIVLRTGGKNWSYLLHRLVALSFVSGDKSLHVAHLDGSRDNNHYLNLKWVSPKENNSHMAIHGTRASGNNHRSTVLCDRSILAIRTLSASGLSLSEIGYLFAISPGYASRIVNEQIRKKIDLKFTKWMNGGV